MSDYQFDTIIVGAGSAGCVLANRLSADPDHSVCLVEAGPSDNSFLIGMPAGILALMWDRSATQLEILFRARAVSK